MSGSRAKQQRQDQLESTFGLPRMSAQELADFKTDYDAQQGYHGDWEEKEALLLTQTADQISKQFNSKITDGRLSTLVIESAARVMAQLPTGVVRALTKRNKGLAAIMSLFLTKYVQVRDKQQFDHLTKMRMADMYSKVYGVMPALYDLAITEDYLGPRSTILPIRSWYPQVGKYSVDDSDHNHVEVFRSAGKLEELIGKGSFNEEAIRWVLKKAKEDGGISPISADRNQTSITQQTREGGVSQDGGKGKAAKIRLVTRYENGKEGRWKTFCPDYENVIVRDIKSQDGHIPIVLKHHIPLIDSIYGLGAFERGKTIQYAMDSLVAMYMAGVQMSIFPPRIIKKGKVVLSSLEYAPGKTWIETDPTYVRDAIRNYQVSPDGLATFQSTYGWLTGSLLNQNGATDTSQTVKSTSDPSAGKTPEALKQQQSRQSAADAWDRAMMESFIGTLYERMINMAPLTPKPFTFHIFDDEIKQIADSGMPDVMDIYDSGKEALITLPKDKIGGPIYRFYIDPGTTMQQDQAAEHEIYKGLLDSFVAAPQLIAAIQASGYQVNLGEIARQYVITGGAKDPEKLISKIEQQATEGTPMGLPAGAGGQPGAPGAANIPQILSGEQPQAPEPPDPSKDPTHEFIKTHFPKLPASAQRAILTANGLPSDGLLPVEAEMVKALSSPSQFDEQGIKEDLALIEIDENSPFKAAKDPMAHLQGSQDPDVQAMFQAISSHLPAQAGQPAPAAAPAAPEMAGVA